MALCLPKNIKGSLESRFQGSRNAFTTQSSGIISCTLLFMLFITATINYFHLHHTLGIRMLEAIIVVSLLFRHAINVLSLLCLWQDQALFHGIAITWWWRNEQGCVLFVNGSLSFHNKSSTREHISTVSCEKKRRASTMFLGCFKIKSKQKSDNV